MTDHCCLFILLLSAVCIYSRFIKFKICPTFAISDLFIRVHSTVAYFIMLDLLWAALIQYMGKFVITRFPLVFLCPKFGGFPNISTTHFEYHLLRQDLITVDWCHSIGKMRFRPATVRGAGVALLTTD